MRPCVLAMNIAVRQQCVRLAGYAYLPSWNGAAVFASFWLSRRVHASGLLLPMLALATDALGPTARLATEGRAMRQANSWLVADFMCACGRMIASAARSNVSERDLTRPPDRGQKVTDTRQVAGRTEVYSYF